jgi:hypothetical protein
VKQVTLIGLLAASFATAAIAGTAGGRQAPSAAACGGPLWRMKTLSDLDRNKVQLSPRGTTIGAILQRHAPSVLPRRRSTPFQKQTWEVPAQIISFRRDGNELRLQLFDDRSYMYAVIPSPSCLPQTSRARTEIAAAWQKFMSDCGHATGDDQPSGAVVSISGVGFWSQHRTMAQREASNGAELHPVTGLRPVAGCGS